MAVKNVREGYKMTELGEIPEEWEVRQVQDLIHENIIIDVLDGNHGEIHPKSSDYVEKGIPFIMANNISNGKLDLERCKFISEEQSKTLRKGFAIAEDILLTHKGTVGETAIVPNTVKEYIVLTPQVTYYRLKKNNRKIYNHYLKIFFDSELFQGIIKSLSSQSTRDYIGITEQKKLNIILPLFEEQQKISLIISSLDEQIEITDNLIEKTKELKKGLMQKLLTKGIGHSRFKVTEIGGIPEEWEVKKLKEIVEFYNGKPHENEINDEGKYILINSKFISTEGKVVKRTENCLFPLLKGDVTMVMSDVPNGKAIAKTFLVPKDGMYTLNQRICCLRTNEMNKKFLSYIVNRNKYYLKFDDGVKQTNLRKEEVLDLLVPIPPIPEQNSITDIISSVEKQINQYKSKREKLQELKKGLMQKLLTGKVRVKA